MIAAIHHVDVSPLGLLIGLLLAAAIILGARWLADGTGERVLYVLGVIAAVAVFVLLGFSFS